MKLNPEDGPINLGILAAGLSGTLVELRYEAPPRYSEPFNPADPPRLLNSYIELFKEFVICDEGWEPEARRGLCYLLNLEDEELLEWSRKLDISYPSGSAREIRYFLAVLWEHTFAHWNVEDFDPSSYEVSGV